MNEGQGYFDFSTPGQFPTGFVYSNAFAWGDVDGDLDVDCVIANHTGYADMLMINDGTGRFVDESDKRLPEVWDTTLGVTSGDIDNDGDFDLLIANNGLNNRFNRILINDGLGYFTDETEQRYPFVEEQTLTMVPGDVDSDGDLDCFVVNFGESLDPFSGQNHPLINQSKSTPDSFPLVIPRTYHHPDTGDTTNPYLITTTVWDNISVVIGELVVSLFYRALSHPGQGSSEVEFIEVPMLDCGGFLYRERIPAQGSGTIVEYYVLAEDRMGNVSTDPPATPDSVFSFLVDVSLGIGDESSSPTVPKTFSLSQNYPNPFNPSTTIDYTVPDGNHVPVTLSRYDLRGRLVRSLVEEERGPGRYSVHWDGRYGKGGT